MLFSKNVISVSDFSFYISKNLDMFILTLTNFILFIYIKKYWIFFDKIFTKFKFFFFRDYIFFCNKMRIILQIYNVFYYSKLRLKGLGFRIRQFGSCLFRFFFTYVNFFYLHIPFGISLNIKGVSCIS